MAFSVRKQQGKRQMNNITFYHDILNLREEAGAAWSLRGCSLQQSLEQKTANIPELLSPYTIVADETFLLKEYILQPYPESLTQEQRIFNYRVLMPTPNFPVSRKALVNMVQHLPRLHYHAAQAPLCRLRGTETSSAITCAQMLVL
ncbi:unnamed protein product [Gadus morhua 'NCC']